MEEDTDARQVRISSVTWYFPHWLMRRVARRLDRSARGRRRDYHARLLDRISRDEADSDDLDDFLSIVRGAWFVLCFASMVPALVVIGIAAILHGLGSFIWLVGFAGSLIPGVVSFAAVMYLHSFALLRLAEDDEDESALVRYFSLPRRLNLAIIPVVMLLSFVVIGANTDWFRA